MNTNELKALTKIGNSTLIKSIYPMIEKIKFNYVEHFGLILEIIINDPSITKDNMYKMGFDPHYLIEIHLKNVIRYLGLEKPPKISGFVIYYLDGEKIADGLKYF